MTTISNNLAHTQKTLDYFTSNKLARAGYTNTVKNGRITISTEISDSDLEELSYVFEGYEIVKK